MLISLLIWLMEPVRGFEPLTCGLRNRCSATELHRLGTKTGNSDSVSGNLPSIVNARIMLG